MSTRTACLTLCLALAIPAAAEDGGPSPRSPAKHTGEMPDRPIAREGRRVFIDPDTGEILSAPPDKAPPAAPALSPRALQALSTSHQGLYQVVLPDGSLMVDLQGRFQHMAVATLEPSGEPKQLCVGNQPVLDAATREAVSGGHEHQQ